MARRWAPGKGQPPVKGLHAHPPAGRACHVPPPLPQQLQAAGQQKQLLEHQPPPGHLQGLRRGGKVDVLICIVYITQLVGLPHLIRQHVRQQLPAGVQPLAGGPGHQPLGDSGGQGIDGHDAPGDLLPPLRLKQGVDHLLAPQIVLHLAEKDAHIPLVQGVPPVLHVEKHQVQRPAVVHHPGLGNGAASGNAIGRQVRRHHAPDAYALPGGQLPDGPDLGPVLIPPGEIGDQVPQGGNAQLFQGGGPGLADALDISHIGAQVCHKTASFVLISGGRSHIGMTRRRR